MYLMTFEGGRPVPLVFAENLASLTHGSQKNRHGKKGDVPTHSAIGIMLIGDLCQSVELSL